MPKPILIDSDMALDDWMAILYLLRHPDADVKAIAVVATGEAHAGPGVRSALSMLALAGHPLIPVSAGPKRPLKGKNAFPWYVRFVVDTRMRRHMPRPLGKPASLDAVALTIKALEEASEPLTVVAIGPLTNLGLVLKQRPDLVNKLAEVVIMGGAVDVEGNIKPVDPRIDNDYAEWNIFCDPHSANLVLASGAPVTLVSLDGTNDVPFSLDFMNRISQKADDPVFGFLHQALKMVAKREEKFSEGSYFFWDALAAVLALRPEIGRYETARIKTVEENGPQCGRTARDEDGWEVKVCTGADRKAFEDLFIEGLGN
jgi:inosine-uridine nucleoside N-ribohydrolase